MSGKEIDPRKGKTCQSQRHRYVDIITKKVKSKIDIPILIYFKKISNKDDGTGLNKETK